MFIGSSFAYKRKQVICALKFKNEKKKSTFVKTISLKLSLKIYMNPHNK